MIYIDTTALESSSLSCHLSATCMALHIRFYLGRYRANLLWKRVTHRIQKRYYNFGGYTFKVQILYVLVVHGIQQLRNGRPDFAEDVECELISNAIRVHDNAARLMGLENVFCTICQGNHVRSECVSPLKCSRIFGHNCLETLLNRDSESSCTCPNCRGQFHEPLQWRVVAKTMDGNVLKMGLLGTQYASMIELASQVDGNTLQHSVPELG